MNNIKQILRMNEMELRSGAALDQNASWHYKYKNSAWCYAGNLPIDLTEGDIICVFSQYGEIEDINLARDDETGKSRGFAFIKYEDARSCILAVDNLIGTKILGRPMNVDHVEKYRLPKRLAEKEDASSAQAGAGHAYQDQKIIGSYDICKGQDLFVPLDDTKLPLSKVDLDQKMNEKKRDITLEDEQQAKREAKRLRKEARAQIRRERELKKQKKKEKKQS